MQMNDMTSNRPRIYLDNNATTRSSSTVVDEMIRLSQTAWANPASRHADGRAARRVLETARETLQRLLHAETSQLVFTSGGTEANNLALFGLARGPRRIIAVTPGDHPSTAAAIDSLCQEGHSRIDLPIDTNGRIDPDGLAALPWDEIGLVCVLLAHNETGVIQDVTPLADRCAQQRIPWHVDAVQAVGKFPVDFETLGATTLSFASHKFHGPRGIGGLLIRNGCHLTPQLFGGHQEADIRPGTESVILAAGMMVALELWQAEATDRTTRITALRDRFELLLQNACPPVIVHGQCVRRLPNTSNLAFPGTDGEALLVALDLAGIACSLGSACASGSTEPAPILLAMGCPKEIYSTSVRFSLSYETTVEEVDDAV